MDRKKFLVASALAVGLPGAVLSSSKEARKKKFVLVHGAWFGGWCWKKLTALLHAAGHSVYAPTLTGLGDRAHLLNADVSLDTHIEDIASLIEFEDLENVTLVGHSYAGMVVTGVAERIPSRLSSVIYLDAFLPENGKALVDYVPPAPPSPPSAEPWRVKPMTTAEGFGITDPDDIAWVNKRLRDQPLKTILQPIQTTGKDKDVKKSYIQCSETPWFSEAAARAKKKQFITYELFGGGHNAMITKPKELAKILLNDSI
ncbi:alpha/beta fold hydrolase [Pseudochryseolinea flava]|uniref:Alpha/beta hydrolase n=1 Tax=Pseudochryseolinea flava TaxID=2059302 RepID=A0A364Y1Y6_9BACT|nr:alpha/beta hydrolase family protein [Pseudochryseolinea flava]RAV99979.1 alpha/beta hydrolase [Pseudochryseolinea flava]